MKDVPQDQRACLLSPDAWVFAGGDFRTTDLDFCTICSGDLLVGVDRGIEHCLSVGLVPDVLMGDFDSVDPALLDDIRLKDAHRQRFPTRKNSSDLDLALQWLCTTGISKVTLLAVSGGRSDHHLFNWLLPLQQSWPFALDIIDASVHAHLVTRQYPLNAPATIGQTISLVPMPVAAGVVTCGLEYPLLDASMNAGSTLGLSNVAAESGIKVTVEEGQLLVFRVRTDNMRKHQGSREV